MIPLWIGAAWRGAERFLSGAVTIPIWIGALAGVVLLGAFGLNGHSRFQAGLTKGAEAERAAQKKITAKVVKRQDRVTAKAETKAVKAQAQIEYRYRTLREKVRVYVPTEAPPGVIRAGDLVPSSTVLLLDAAVRGDEPEPLSVTGGRTYETGSAFRFDQLVDNYVVNLKVGHQNARQLTDLQGWVRGQEAAGRAPP